MHRAAALPLRYWAFKQAPAVPPPYTTPSLPQRFWATRVEPQQPPPPSSSNLTEAASLVPQRGPQMPLPLGTGAPTLPPRFGAPGGPSSHSFLYPSPSLPSGLWAPTAVPSSRHVVVHRTPHCHCLPHSPPPPSSGIRATAAYCAAHTDPSCHSLLPRAFPRLPRHWAIHAAPNQATLYEGIPTAAVLLGPCADPAVAKSWALSRVPSSRRLLTQAATVYRAPTQTPLATASFLCHLLPPGPWAPSTVPSSRSIIEPFSPRCHCLPHLPLPLLRPLAFPLPPRHWGPQRGPQISPLSSAVTHDIAKYWAPTRTPVATASFLGHPLLLLRYCGPSIH